jgi:beta-glucosidase
LVRINQLALLFPFQNRNLPLEQRVSDLVSRMTLDEKVSQMLFDAPSINRLGIPEDIWWGEALHAAEHIPTIMTARYPGQVAGLAIADVLFGNYSPTGRLPVTFYKAANELPPFANYSMEGRTYRYFRGEPLFPFGPGLSPTRFEYRNLRVPMKVNAGDEAQISVTVKNGGNMDGEEVVQLYVTDVHASAPVPIRSLRGFQRVFLKAREQTSVHFLLTPCQLSFIDVTAKLVVEPGIFRASIGGKQPGFKGIADASTTEVLTDHFEVVGSRPFLDEKH